MLKFKLHHFLSVVVAVVVVGSVVYINTASYFSTEPAEPGNPTAPISVGKTSVERIKTRRWQLVPRHLLC